MTSQTTLRNELDDFDGLHVAAHCGLLQLLPANAQHADRLLALAAAALERGPAGARSVTRSDLERWLTASPSLHTGPPWDPYEGPFTEPITFIGGGHLLLTGGDPAAVFHLRAVLHALFRRRLPLPPTTFNTTAFELAQGVLALSSHTCRIAGLRRWQAAETSDVVVIPPPSELRRLTAAIVYSSLDLARLTGVDPEVLRPIVHDLAASGPPKSLPTGTQFTARPLIKRDDTYVLVDPGSLAIALRHALISCALQHHSPAEVQDWFSGAAIDHVLTILERMRWRYLASLPAPSAPIASNLADFDADKVANIVVLSDDLDGYRANDPETTWNATRWDNALRNHLRNVERALLLGPPPRPNSLLHIVVLAGVGRPLHFGLPSPEEPLRAPHLLLSLENLDQISMGRIDALRLWKYARAAERLREQCHVVALGTLDEFAAWNDNQSYYMSDDARPTMVLFDGSFGRHFRETIARETDVHAAISPHGTSVEVVRIHADGEIPVYGVLHDLGGQPLLLVEGAALPIWVRGPARYANPIHRRVHAQIVDCVAYWLWQFTPSLPDLASGTGQPRVVVDIEIEDPDQWMSELIPTASGETATATVLNDGVLKLTLRPALAHELQHADNRGERTLARVLLSGVDRLLTTSQRLNTDGIDTAIERHAPLGSKKKINVLAPEREAALLEGALPEHRLVSPAETDRLLDEAGSYVGERFSLRAGTIVGPRRVAVINAVVAFHFDQLKREVATLSPDGLLELLVAMYEAMAHHEAVERHTLRARMAAFGETRAIEQLRDSLQEATQSAIALRFLVEYVTAAPPRGLRPISFDFYDRLLAMCSQIATWGMSSDIIHFEIEDTDVDYLRSGRLGVGRGPFQAGRDTFLDAFVPAHARAITARYAKDWAESESEAPPDALEIDAAAKAEWGFSFRELLEFLRTLSASAHEHNDAVASLPVSELEADLTGRLGWPEPRVRDAIALFSLEPRDAYLEVPAGFRKHDLWPWRFNRGLSYLRRPLLLRPGSREAEVVWGVRQPEQAGEFLFRLIVTQRLQASSGEMKRLMTRLGQRESQQFVDKVADLHREHGMAVDTNVRKVDGERITRSNGEDLADVDVLAADRSTRVIFALECKDLEGARTPAELANELVTTFRSHGGTRSAADRQVERVEWLKQRIPQTLRHLGVEGDDVDWQVEGAMITDVHVLSPHVAECPLPVYAWDELVRLRSGRDTTDRAT